MSTLSLWGQDDGQYRLITHYGGHSSERYERFRITMPDGSIISESYMDLQRTLVSPDGTLLTIHLRGRIQEPITFTGHNLEKLQEKLDTHEMEHISPIAQGQNVADEEHNPPVVTGVVEGVSNNH